MSISLYAAVPGARFYARFGKNCAFIPAPEFSHIPNGPAYEIEVMADCPPTHVTARLLAFPSKTFDIPYEFLISDDVKNSFLVFPLDDPYKDMPPTGGSLT